MGRPLPRSWFKEEAVALAPRLLGKTLKKGACAGRIVEVEAYTDDPASHARTKTDRSALMYDTYGHWYVYLSYGMHRCLNVTAGDGPGAILIRAVEPTDGIAEMEERRAMSGKAVANGPGKLAEAFGIMLSDNGKPVADGFTILDAPELPASRIASGPRIGISRATELPWRFWVRGNPFVSR